MAITTTDKYSREIISEDQAMELLYTNPRIDIKLLSIENVLEFNQACDVLYLDWHLTEIEHIEVDVDKFHAINQSEWAMPISYKDFDIAKWCLEQCQTETELQRVGKELLLFQDRDMFGLLQFLHYFVTTMRTHNVVWGVGRGSSVSSYVLYLIGIHKIDSIYYGLDIEEFLK